MRTSKARELLASRMGPTATKLDVAGGGGSGRPDLTAQDIAAALGMVPPGLGRELLETCYWPDSCRGSMRLRDEVVALVVPEFKRQLQELADARTDFGLAEVCVGWVGRTTLEQRQYRERCRDRLESLKKKCWPVSTLESLPTLAGAIVQELTSKGACRSCGGVGKRAAGEHLLVCPECGGEGVAEVSDRQRAALIGRDESTYRAKWRVVYEWLFDRMSAAEATAADQLARALSRHAA